MNSHAITAAQKAVYAALSADTSLSALVTGIYDAVPDEAAFPYVWFVDSTASDDATLAAEGCTVRVALEAVSNYRGRKQALDIAEAIEAALEAATLSAEGYAVSDWFVDETTVQPVSRTQFWKASLRITLWLDAT